jgi:primary-amine oxidase
MKADDDRVVFFNLGTHHVPHSGDIPNTLMHTSASSVMFTPFNFHDRDPTRRSAQGVRIDNGNEGTKARYYGGRYRDGVTLKEVGRNLSLMLETRKQYRALF